MSISTLVRGPTYADFARDWHARYAPAHYSPAMQLTSADVLRLHLVPGLGATRVRAITTQQIEGYKADRLKVVSASSVNTHLSILSASLRCAVEWGVIKERPTFRYCKKVPPPFDFFGFEESEKLLAACEPGTLDEVMIRCALRTGMRRGELLGLQWDAIAPKRIGIVRAFSAGTLTHPKSKRSRWVPPAVDLLESLERWRHDRGPFVFCRPDEDEPLTAYDIRRTVTSACQRAGLRPLNWHALRHSFASHLVMRGVSLVAVQQLLGHHSVTETMRYAHLSEGHLHEAIGRLVPSNAAVVP